VFKKSGTIDIMSDKTKDFDHLSSRQYASADNVRARWDLYEFAVPRIDIHQTGIEHLSFRGNEDILEVGCGDGSVLIDLRRHGHVGKLIGQDINKNIFQTSINAQKAEYLHAPVEFIVGSADHLPFADKSFDVILAFFMLYHMPNISKTLYEWRRILKDDGKVLISTASAENRRKNKIFKKVAEDSIGYAARSAISSSFNLENAEDQLRGIFTIADRFIYEGTIKIEHADPYLRAYDSVRDMYDPIPSDLDWERARNLIKKEVEKEIAQNGYFTDNVKRGFFICQKT
jgi:ubiquinone/menaquinone biosynthesis C-methylase UbiE